MGQLGNRALVNGIIVDEFLIDGWPDEWEGCWIGVRVDGDPRARTLYLTRSNTHQQGTVVEIDQPEEITVASISWDILYRFQTAYVNLDERGQGIGFILARWARTWVAKNEGKTILMPWHKNRSPETQEWIRQWAEIYGDPETPV